MASSTQENEEMDRMVNALVNVVARQETPASPVPPSVSFVSIYYQTRLFLWVPILHLSHQPLS